MHDKGEDGEADYYVSNCKAGQEVVDGPVQDGILGHRPQKEAVQEQPPEEHDEVQDYIGPSKKKECYGR